MSQTSAEALDKLEDENVVCVERVLGGFVVPEDGELSSPADVGRGESLPPDEAGEPSSPADVGAGVSLPVADTGGVGSSLAEGASPVVAGDSTVFPGPSSVRVRTREELVQERVLKLVDEALGVVLSVAEGVHGMDRVASHMPLVGSEEV